MKESENRPIGERLDDLKKTIEIAQNPKSHGIDISQDRLDIIIEEAEKEKDLLLLVKHIVDTTREGREIRAELQRRSEELIGK